KEKIVAAKLTSTAKVSDECVIANTPQAVRKYFAALTKEADVVAAYEAGCFGFGLYHQLTDLGVAAVVAAPGLIPRKPSDRLKTDRRDARTLALALRAGQLTAVHVPTKQDESVRDYLRMCEDMRDDLRKCKQRILHLLLRRGIRYEQGGPWTVKHKNWLATLDLGSPLDRQTLDSYLARLQELESTCSQLASEVEGIAEGDRYREPVRTLSAFKGIKTLIALSFITEIGDFRRFSSAAQFMAFLGLVPSEHSSGNKRRQGGITKAGNSHLRRLLVEAAWHYRSYHPHQPRPGREASRSGSSNHQLRQPRRQAAEPQVPAPAAARQEISARRHRGLPRAGRVHLGSDGRSGSLSRGRKPNLG
ncbi:MAG TPA: IS110 family transposase, partial [Spirochaetia bacterium]|nr:IS110 family transposase [Spirochaetia bacterium]